MMEKERWPGLIRTFLILTALSCCSGMEVSILQAQYEVAKGSDITLKCTFTPANPDFSMLIITWEGLPTNNVDKTIPVATYWSTGPQVDIAPSFEGRAVLSTDPGARESSLLLKQVTMQDSRRYQCSVKIPQDDEGTTLAITSLLVLVAPSKPICSLQGSAEYWQDIRLTCLSEEGSPAPTYGWQSYDVKNMHRKMPPKTTEKDGVLSLFNISMDTSGYYICLSENRIGSASCNFTLMVMPPSMNIGSTAGIIGGILAAVLLLGIIVYCCCRKKEKRDKYTQGSQELQEFHDKPPPKPDRQYWDDEANNENEPHIEPVNHHEEKGEKDYHHQDNYSDSKVRAPDHFDKYEDDQHSNDSREERYNGNTNDRYGGSRDRHDDQRNRSGGSRDRLDDGRYQYSGSQDNIDDQRDRYGGSRDRLDDHRGRYGGSRDRLDDQGDHYNGGRDRLDDHRGRYGGSRDRLDDQGDRYGGSRDRLDDHRGRYGGSRDRLDDPRDYRRGSRDRLEYDHDQYD